jgi:hypothetical protein
MNLGKQKHLLFFTALIVLILLSEYYILGITPNPETQRYKLWFAIGPHSPFKLDNSLLWLSQFNFGTPRLGNPLLINYSPSSYFGLLIQEPYLGLIIWSISLFLGIWGGFKLFQQFCENRIIAFISGTCFSLSGVMIITALIGVTIEQIPCTTWTLYFLVKYIKSNNLKFLFTSVLIHALHFYISSGFPTWFYLSAFISFYMFGVEISKIIANKEKILIKSTLLNILKNQFIYFGLLFSFLAIILLPIIEMMPYVSHRHLEIGDPGYRYAGRFNPSEFFLFPFLFPGIYKTGNQFFSFVNLSYIGYAPLFFSLLWIKNSTRRICQIIIITLCVIIFAASSFPPIDTLLRFIPALTETRLSSMWMFCWNLAFLYMMILSLRKLGNEIKFPGALKFSYLCMMATFLILIFLYFGHLLKFDFGFNINLPVFNGKSYPTPPDYLINYEYWNWIESLRPIFVSICITLTLLLIVKSLISYKTMLLIIAFISILDISTWVGNRTLNYTNQHIQLDNQYRNNMLHLERFEGFQPPALGKGRALFFGLPKSFPEQYNFLAYRQYFESVHPATSLPTKRGFKMSILLGWNESDMIDAGHIYKKLSIEDFLLSDKIQLARSLNIKYYFSNQPISNEYLKKFSFKRIRLDDRIGMYLYEDLEALSRVIAYGKIKVVDNYNHAFELIKNNKAAISKEALVEKKNDDLKNINEILEQNDLKIISYAPTKIILNTNFSKDSYIVLSEINYPGWSVDVDGRKNTIYSSNLIGKGVFVEPGNHRVIFKYQPKYYFAGIIISVIGVLTFLVYAFVASRKHIYTSKE